MLRSIRVFMSDGRIEIVNDVATIDMEHDQLVLYGDDDNMRAAWPAGGWSHWKDND